MLSLYPSAYLQRKYFKVGILCFSILSTHGGANTSPLVAYAEILEQNLRRLPPKNKFSAQVNRRKWGQPPAPRSARRICQPHLHPASQPETCRRLGSWIYSAILKIVDSSLPYYRPMYLICWPTTCKAVEAVKKDQLICYLLFKGLFK